MIKGKIAGLAISGLAGYLIIGKAVNLIDRCVRNVCDAAKWRAYYKNNRDPLSVPPGYSSSTRQIDDNTELAVENPKEAGKSKQKESNSVQAAKIVEAVTKAIDEWVDKKQKTEKPDSGRFEWKDIPLSENTKKLALQMLNEKKLTIEEIAEALGITVQQAKEQFGITESEDIFDKAPDDGNVMVADSLEEGVVYVDPEMKGETNE